MGKRRLFARNDTAGHRRESRFSSTHWARPLWHATRMNSETLSLNTAAICDGRKQFKQNLDGALVKFLVLYFKKGVQTLVKRSTASPPATVLYDILQVGQRVHAGCFLLCRANSVSNNPEHYQFGFTRRKRPPSAADRGRTAVLCGRRMVRLHNLLHVFDLNAPRITKSSLKLL